MEGRYALCIDMEDLVNFYFRTKYGGEVWFDGEYLVSGRDYSELVLPYYKIIDDPDGSIDALHGIVLEAEQEEIDND